MNDGIQQVYAHSLPGRPQSEWQKLEQHLKTVAEKGRTFAESFGSGDWAWNAGWLHDVGKAEDEFQAYLLRENGLDDSEYDVSGGGRINHSSAGAALAADIVMGIQGQTLAYLAAGHHAGLSDWFSNETGNAALSIRLEEGRMNLARIRSVDDICTNNLKGGSKPPPFVNPKNYHLWVRMLYSSLVDADFLDTEAFMQPDQTKRRSGFASLGDLKTKFDTWMLNKVRESPKTPVNVVRQEVLAACRAAGGEAPGLFSLTVPTGGGKTLSGMAFALDHAILHGKERIIYVIPYTSIIEQTADILREIVGNDNVVEHHSNLDPEKETPRSQAATENWDAPVIVTTNVQFFESLYAAKSGRCRKLHNVVNSVVILDEAQLIPPQWLDPCVHVIDELTNHYGVTIVLSTATQPALPKLDRGTEIIPKTMDLYTRLKRVDYHLPDLRVTQPVTWKALSEQLQKHKSVLCVVNSRRDCYDLFKLMPEGTIHLSALMCGQHRSEKIAEIKQLLRAGEQVRVVSTQLVEAGVDIDFPVVYRALCGLDSIAQAAGRCNREGKLANRGEVHVFLPPRDPPRGLLAKAAGTTRELASLPDCDPQQPEVYRRYFELFYSKANDRGTSFLESLSKDIDGRQANVPFRTAGQEFRFIDDSIQRAVLVRYGDSEQWISRLRFAGPTRESMRRLQRYTVNLPTRMVDAMLEDGRLAKVNEKKAPDIVAQSHMKYDDVVGLDIYSESLPVEDLIV